MTGINEGLHPVEGIHTGQIMKNCSPWERLTLEKFLEHWLPWQGPHTGPEGGCEESLMVFSLPCGAEDGEQQSVFGGHPKSSQG